MNCGWVYQGRQCHMWFGHGTKPRDDVAVKDAGIGTLAERIRGLGHALVAGLPTSKRWHPGARLDSSDRARLDRLLTAVVWALGEHPEAPGVDAVVESARQLKAATTRMAVREATDTLAGRAEAFGRLARAAGERERRHDEACGRLFGG